MSWDTTLFFLLNSLAGRTSLIDTGVVFVASWLPYLVVGIFVAYLLFKEVSLREKIVIFFTAMLAAIIARIGIGSPIRYFFPRPRPFLTYQVHQLIPEHAPSFPSGHALFFFAFSTAVYLYNKRLGSILLILTVFICLARVAAGIHYPSDILAGALIGSLCGYLTVRYIQPLILKKEALRI